jgi:preprotein translocase SecE subunit
MSFVLRASSSSLASSSTIASSSSSSSSLRKSRSVCVVGKRRNASSSASRRFVSVRATGEGEEGEEEVVAIETEEQTEERKEEELSVQTQTPGDILRQQKEAKADEGNNIFAGASEEIGLIEWPTAGKAMQTTGVVILGIVLSAVFLLVVNEVLSTLSGKIFN